MKFQANTRRRALEYEKDIVNYWKENKTFEKSIEMRPADNAYVFYDGPPFITGVPHHGTLLSSIVKDAIPRYQTMQGKRVERVWGWDTHGLPAENFVEKKLGIADRHEIGTKISLEDYITTARESMTATGALWEETVDRVGRWVDFKGAYKTMDKNFMESVWWAFKELYEKGKIYEGEKVLMYDTKWATPLSKAEVTMDAGAYIDVTDPSVYVKFKLTQSSSISLPKSPKVLFVCNANAGRSHFAQGFFNHLTDGGAESAGVKLDGFWEEAPTLVALEDILQEKKPGSVKTTDTMNEVGVDVSGHTRQQLSQEMIANYDLVVNIAEKSQTPEWLSGDNVVWWDVLDPKGETWEKNRAARNQIESKVKSLVDGVVIDDSEAPTYLLSWTTTPWTLPGNVALAVNEKVTYVKIKINDEYLVLSEELLPKVITDEKHQPLAYEMVDGFTGAELIGKTYEPLFADRGENAHKVWSADYVTTESGTGIVHLAPAYGEEDFVLAKEKGIPVVHVLDEYGIYTEGPWKGLEVWENNKAIAKQLKEEGKVWKIDYIRHEYPHNPRTGHRLMYRAHPSWFMDIDGQRTEMLEQNSENINWFPDHIKHGRFEKTVETAPDWNLSRDRFWATAMPVWKGTDADGNEHVKVVGSYAELKELSGVELEDYHRPWVDDIEFDLDGVHYTRIDKVIDCWFESGSMPFAQFHYPFENVEKFEANFPGDFIVEYVGQVRAWFYYVHAVNVGLFGHNAFKNVIVTGNVAGNDGRKMSKSLGNFTDPNLLMDQYSADSLRFLLLSSPLLSGEDFALQDKDVGDVARKLSMIWNMYDFFTMYAEVDGWEFDGELTDPLQEVSSPLDQWIISRIHQLITEIEERMNAYDVASAVKPILPFIDDASNWYVRRSRRRFWKSDDARDKNDAYRTLHYVLVRLAQAIAPFTPFLAEELYRKLTGEESVHLTDWPKVGAVDQVVLDHMTRTREIIEAGLGQRMRRDDEFGQIKVRQPLAGLTYGGEALDEFYETIIAEEVNVKKVNASGEEVVLDKQLTPELHREGLAREVIRHIQSARKNAGLNVDDRIIVSLATEDENLTQAIAEHESLIFAEVLAVSRADSTAGESTIAKIEGIQLTITLEKSA